MYTYICTYIHTYIHTCVCVRVCVRARVAVVPRDTNYYFGVTLRKQKILRNNDLKDPYFMCHNIFLTSRLCVYLLPLRYCKEQNSIYLQGHYFI